MRRPYADAAPPGRPVGLRGRGAWTMAPWLASGIRPYTGMQEASMRPGLSGSVDCHVDHSLEKSWRRS